MRIALTTCQSWPDLCPDDQPVRSVLNAHGVDVSVISWDTQAVGWSTFDAVVVRSTWDYHRRPKEFLAWLDRLDTEHVRCWNPTRILRWNFDKTYLRDLADRGARTIPTEWLAQGARYDLSALLDRRGWRTVVVKPTISASGEGTHLLSDPRSCQAIVDELLARGDVMIQPFLELVRSEGEWSLVYLGDQFSHAVRKLAAPGEFRVQEDYGGRTFAAEPPPSVRRGADAILQSLGARLLYARIDGFDDVGEFLISELELIEPLLFFSHAPGSAERFAEMISRIATVDPVNPVPSYRLH